jgi:hypothetical protein
VVSILAQIRPIGALSDVDRYRSRNTPPQQSSAQTRPARGIDLIDP